MFIARSDGGGNVEPHVLEGDIIYATMSWIYMIVLQS
jgi:hypothetical protein